MESDNNILKEFYRLAEYVNKIGEIENLEAYKTNFHAFLLHASHIKAYDFIAPKCKNKKVLDIGCYIGYGEQRIANFATEVIAVDTDSTAIEYANQHNIFPNIKFEISNAKKLPFIDGTFDVVIAFQVIEHIPPKEVLIFLYETKRVLKNDGFLILSTPNRKFRLGIFQPPFNLDHHQEFTQSELLKILEINFSDVKIKGVKAQKWIEDIEKMRIHKTFVKGYIYVSFLRFFEKFYPKRTEKMLKKIKSIISKPPQAKESLIENNNNFNIIVKKFSMDHFYLEDKALDDSMELIAICKK